METVITKGLSWACLKQSVATHIDKDPLTRLSAAKGQSKFPTQPQNLQLPRNLLECLGIRSLERIA